MIESHQLDETIIRFESNPKEIDKLLDHVQSEQSLLLDILIGTHAELLTEEEMDYLLFLFLGIYGTFQKVKSIQPFSEAEVMKAEEFSWKILNENNDYDKAMEIFFTEIKETEVMDFIDLSIAPDDENEVKITDPGRLIMLAVLTALTKLMEEV
ncbi:MAG: hypothetical protein ABUT20_57360 [Bacteroidota bacterium]